MTQRALVQSTIQTVALTGQTEFTVPFEYLARKYVEVTLIGPSRVLLTLNTDYRFVSKTVISVTKPYGAEYTKLELRRRTSASERLVDFHDGSVLRAYDLNLSQIQTLHIAEEARDAVAIDGLGIDSAGNLDARNRRIVNVLYAQSDSDAVPLGQIIDREVNAFNDAERAKRYAEEAQLAAGTAGMETLTEKSFGIVKDSTIDQTDKFNQLFAMAVSNRININPGVYRCDGDIVIPLVGQSTIGTGVISAYNVHLIGQGAVVIDSCKHLNIEGLYFPTKDLVLNGCWYSNFKSMVFRRLICGRAQGTVFTTNYWNAWESCRFQVAITAAANSEYNNKFDFYSCTMRGKADQGHTNTAPYAFDFVADVNAQGWNFWGGDVSYHTEDIVRINQSSDKTVELNFIGTYFDTKWPSSFAKSNKYISTTMCHAANDIPIVRKLSAISRGTHNALRRDRGVYTAGACAMNLIPNGDLRVGLTTWAGAGYPIGASGGATITDIEDTTTFSGRALSIENTTLGATAVRFRAPAVPHTGQYTATLFLKSKSGYGTQTLKLAFNGLYETIDVQEDEYVSFTMTLGDNVAAGTTLDIQIGPNGNTGYGIVVGYAGVVFGAGLGGVYVPNIPSKSVAYEGIWNISTNPAGTSKFTDVPAKGATTGSMVTVSGDKDLQGGILTGQVLVDDMVRVTFTNPLTTPITVASTRLKIKVEGLFG